ncbi:capsid protein [Citromicrobium sp. RCC1885]|uniref:phage major capsid protein n=1 Tax=unclassified Citromicrobium TaxID=2630544 RepID=UPI0006C928D5|nr:MULTISPECIES: phage major capsid protein [unclassified Citromicrobium]KPM20385.1 capsid protein [Citromicrobium sp. JL2201]KPM23037.1 capsid protein [Citromicrobium sp. RCC1885]KPM27179.1 capsid protein [Citromicrobium sp. RCC1878]OAM09050.1 capsid protein [Citromicrobium sp. RCC1897]|tara:strand:+ start:18626 stop:19948 length:1323 start_codon:yes stop_codon:yes gene_type:complete
MAGIKDLSLKQAEEKLATIQDNMGTVLKEALTDNGQKDFSKVTFFGSEVKGSVAVAEKFQQLDAEANELGEHIDTLRGAEKAAQNYEAREKGMRNFPLPGAGADGRPANVGQFKSLGAQAVETKAFKQWLSEGCPEGISMQFEKALASDFIASGARGQTIGSKALMSTAAGFAPESVRMPGFVEMPTRPIQLVDILPLNRTGQTSVKYMEETTRTHAAAETAEGAAFKEDAFAFTERTSDVRKIPTSIPVTDEQFEDVPLIEGYINNRLPFSLRQRLDFQVGMGNGGAPNLRGIFNTPGILTQAIGADAPADAFFKAMTKIRVEGRALPTHNLIHPYDWQDIRLERTADGIYIYGAPTEDRPDRLWGLPVVQYEPMGQGKGLVGSFMPEYIELVERRGIDIQVGYVNAQFAEGKRTVRADMRAALPVYRPSAFSEVNLTE